MPLSNYINLKKNIKNWPLYFKRKYFKPADNAIYVTRGHSLKIEVPDHFFYVFKEIFMEDFYEMDKLLQHVPENAVIVDVGANVGFFSFLMAGKRKNARIYSYEPMENNLELFNSNLDRNTGSRSIIKAERKAVTGKKTEFVKLFFDDVHANTVISSIYEDFSKDNTKTTEIEAISLEEIISKNELGVIDVLKLDCEGSEYPILYDSPASVWPLIKCLCIEVHEMNKEKRNHAYLSGFLKDKGYLQKSRLDANGCYYLLAWK
jgi:FkbM family methyltransferase